MCAQQAFHGLHVLLLRKPSKVIKITQRLVQHPVRLVSEVSSVVVHGEAHSVSLTFLRSLRRFATRAFNTSEASERVRVSTFWNSPRFSTAEASSLPGGGGLGREVLFDMVDGGRGGNEAEVRLLQTGDWVFAPDVEGARYGWSRGLMVMVQKKMGGVK